MPIGLAGGFDIVLQVSSSSLASIVESGIRSNLTIVGAQVTFSLGGLGNFTCDDIEVAVYIHLGAVPGAAFDLEIRFRNGSVLSTSLGSGFSTLTIPCTMSAPNVLGGQNIVVTLDNTTAVFQTDATLTGLITAATISQAFHSPTVFNAMLAAAGMTNPLVLNPTVIPTVALVPAAAVGAAPGLASIQVATLPRPAANITGDDSVVICLNMQHLPNTPPIAGPGATNTIAFVPIPAGSDASLMLETAFLFRLIASLGLESASGLGIPAGSLAATRGGITLPAAVPLTVSGRAGTLTALTVTPPGAAGSTTLTFGMTFVFVADSITYTVTVAGATITPSLNAGQMSLAVTVPAPTVTQVVPWWVYLVRILTGAALGLVTGGFVGMIVGGVLGGLSVTLETALVSAFIGIAVPGAAASLLPAPLLGVLGPLTLTPPLVFDDVQIVGRTNQNVPAREIKRVSCARLMAGQSGIDLMTEVVTSRDSVLGTENIGDVHWYSATCFTVGAGSYLANLAGTFNAVPYTQAHDAVSSAPLTWWNFGLITSVSHSLVPVIPSGLSDPNLLPAPLILAVLTAKGIIGKLALWQDCYGNLIMRYVLWDPKGAACRITPSHVIWTHTNTANNPGASLGQGPINIDHALMTHAAEFGVQGIHLTNPWTVVWSLDGTTLQGNTGSAMIGSATVSWVRNGRKITLKVAAGGSLSGSVLRATVTDARQVVVEDAAILNVSGTVSRLVMKAGNGDVLMAISRADQAYQQHMIKKGLPTQLHGEAIPKPKPVEEHPEAKLARAIEAAGGTVPDTLIIR